MFMYSRLEILVHLANSFWCHILLWFQYGLIHVLLLFWIHFAWVMCYHLIPAVQQYFPWLWRVWIAVTEQLCLGLMAWILLCLLELEENSVWQPLIMRRCPVVVVLACEGLPVSLSAHPFLIMLQEQSPLWLPLRWQRLSDVHVLVSLDFSSCATEKHKKLSAQIQGRGCSRDLGAWIREKGAQRVRGIWWWSDSCFVAGSCTGERSATKVPSKLHQWLSCSVMSYWDTDLIYSLKQGTWWSQGLLDWCVSRNLPFFFPPPFSSTCLQQITA